MKFSVVISSNHEQQLFNVSEGEEEKHKSIWRYEHGSGGEFSVVERESSVEVIRPGVARPGKAIVEAIVHHALPMHVLRCLVRVHPEDGHGHDVQEEGVVFLRIVRLLLLSSSSSFLLGPLARLVEEPLRDFVLRNEPVPVEILDLTLGGVKLFEGRHFLRVGGAFGMARGCPPINHQLPAESREDLG